MNYFPSKNSFSFKTLTLLKNEEVSKAYINTNIFALILVESKNNELDLYINDHLKSVSGDSFVLFIYKEQRYKIVSKGETKVTMLYFNPIIFFDNKNKVEISTLKIHEYRNYVYTSIFLNNEQYHSSIINLTKGVFNLFKENNLSLISDIKDIVFEIVKLIEKEMLYIGYKQVPYEANRDYEDIMPAINLIQNCLEHDELNIKIDDLASACNISNITLLRKFKKVFNDTPHNYINKRKLAYASQLLVKTNLSIGEIAMTLGYSTIYAFEISFKKIYTVSPSNYRKCNYNNVLKM